MSDNLLGIPETRLPVDPAARLLDEGVAADQVAAANPTSSLAWATLAEDALADGRTVDVEAEGDFVRPYEPFHRGGLNVVRVRTGDGRSGTAVYEVTGARHHRFFPDTDVDGVLPC